jgi:hypothetical protein
MKSQATSTFRDLSLLVALGLAAVAFWAPWVNHEAAALKLSGQDLGEFVKFIPVEQARLPRQLFYVPPLACSVSLALVAVNRGARYPRWLRALAIAIAPLLLTGLLPPVWGHPRDLFTAEFRLQGLGIAFGLLVVLSHGLLARIPYRISFALVCGSALLALVLPQGAFWALRPGIWAVYRTPTIHLGWGVWLHVVAWSAALVASGLALFPPFTSSR